MPTIPSLLPLRLALLLAMGLSACSDKDDEDDGSTDSGHGGAASACVEPAAILDADGKSTGYVRCADGAVNRVDASTWDPTIEAARCEGTEGSRSCEVDADCTTGTYGACITGEVKGGFTDGRFCACVYSCATDADCSTGEVCLGAGVVPGVSSWARCVPAACKSGDDCGSGECGASSWDDGCGYRNELACRDEADTCRTGADCDSEMCGVGYDSDTFECQSIDCALGRPLVVAGQPRMAPLARRGEWRAPLQPDTALSAECRARLAAHWAWVGALEHASVASFSRVCLELMGLGAPPELLLQTQQALADEVEHARLAYGLASAYAGSGMGPGSLSLDGVTLRTDPAAILESLVEEACVGETLAAADARAAAETCVDPVVRAVLEQIAQDEARHAALGWRTLRWMLQDRPELWPVAEAALARASASVLSPARTLVDADDAAWGVLTAAARAALHRDALRQVVQPCWEALGAGMVDAAAGDEARA